MNIKLLKKLSNEIERGNGVRAVFWANEYLQANHPLRLALVARAELATDSSELARKAAQGTKVSELGQSEKAELEQAATQILRDTIPQHTVAVTPRRRTQGRRVMPGREVYQVRRSAQGQRQELRRAL